MSNASAKPALKLELTGNDIRVDDRLILSELPENASCKECPGMGNAITFGFTNTAGPTSSVDVLVGRVFISSYMACARIKLFWQTPEFGRTLSSLPPETQFLIAELHEGGPYVAFVPMIDEDTYRFTIRPPSSSNDPNTLVLRMDSGKQDVLGTQFKNALVICASWDPYQLADDAIAIAAKISGGSQTRSEKQLPDSINWFGWCTWDAFYHGVSVEGIRQGLESLKAGGCPPRFLIIDDGWQSTSTPQGGSASYPIHEAILAERKQKDLLPSGADTTSANAVTPETQQSSHDPHLQWHLTGTLSAKDTPHTLGAISTPEAAASTLQQALPSGEAVGNVAVVAPGAPPSEEVKIEADIASLGGSAIISTMQDGSGRKRDSAAKDAARQHAPSLLSPQNKSPWWWLVYLANTVWSITPSPLRPFISSLSRFIPSHYLQRVMDEAMRSPQGSKEVQQLVAAASGPLKQAIVEHYVNTSVHANRLAAPTSNDKFRSIKSGPESGDGHTLVDGFGSVVKLLKEEYGLRYVYVWHALFGYWAGVGLTPDFTNKEGVAPRLVFPSVSNDLLELEPSLPWSHQVLAGVGLPADADALYNEMHEYLQSVGVDGVKVDAQSMVSLFGTAHLGGSKLASKFQGALEASIRSHFPGNHCINCMCHSSENMYRMTNTAVARVSDDFWPLDPASHTTHVAVCAYNSVYMGALVMPDWDMFHSRHPRALLHATARVISGGGVYVSDKPGVHDFGLLRRVVLPDGGLLRPLLPGRPTRDTLFKDPMRDGKTLLKVWNHNHCTGVLAVFHLQGSSWDRSRRAFITHDPQPSPLSTEVKVNDVERMDDITASLVDSCATTGVEATGKFAVFSDRTGSLTVVEGGEGGSVKVTLNAAESDVITIAPVLQCSGVCIAVVGLVNMLNAGGSIAALRIQPHHQLESEVAGGIALPSTAPQEGRVVVEAEVRGKGLLLAYCTSEPAGVWVAGQAAEHRYNRQRCEVVVQVDVATEQCWNKVLLLLR